MMMRHTAMQTITTSGAGAGAGAGAALVTIRRMTCLLLKEGAVAQHRSSSLAAIRCRHQSSLCSTTTFAARTKPTQTVSASASRRTLVPGLRRLPQVNGKSVAFHIRDLLPHQHQQLESQTSAAAVVPAKQRQYESDLTVVLDMDECLLHSQFLSNPMTAHILAHQVQQANRRNNPTNGVSGSGRQVDHFRIQLPNEGDLVHVNMRPGLQEFLDAICSKYETHIFTAAMPIYAKPVLDRLDPKGDKFAARWYRDHCSWDPVRNAYVKDLSALPIPNLARTVLVDNNPLSFLSNPSNGILVSSFYNDPSDQTLDAVVKLIEELEPLDDVRPVLEHRFGLKEALAELMNK